MCVHVDAASSFRIHIPGNVLSETADYVSGRNTHVRPGAVCHGKGEDPSGKSNGGSGESESGEKWFPGKHVARNPHTHQCDSGDEWDDLQAEPSWAWRSILRKYGDSKCLWQYHHLCRWSRKGRGKPAFHYQWHPWFFQDRSGQGGDCQWELQTRLGTQRCLQHDTLQSEG